VKKKKSVFQRERKSGSEEDDMFVYGGRAGV
jgi:hypothetical protein